MINLAELYVQSERLNECNFLQLMSVEEENQRERVGKFSRERKIVGGNRGRKIVPSSLVCFKPSTGKFILT